MKKYALVNNNVVTSIIEIEEESYPDYTKNNSMVIDITDTVPQPVVGYILNGNKLELPQGYSDRESFEIYLSELKTDFGIKLSRTCINRIGARNKILNKTGAQVTTILNSLVGVKMLLETGALGTARYNCVLLKSVYTEYADIFDYIINEVNTFEQSNTL